MMHTYLNQITPIILEIDNGDKEISLAATPEKIHVTCRPWTHIRTTQHATLYINDQPIASTQLLSLEERLALPPVFRVATKTQFLPGQSYNISIGIVEPDGTDKPNSSRSRALTINALP